MYHEIPPNWVGIINVPVSVATVLHDVITLYRKLVK